MEMFMFNFVEMEIVMWIYVEIVAHLKKDLDIMRYKVQYLTKYFEFKSTPEHLPPDNTVWRNTEETKIPIVDGKVSFYDKSTGAYFDLYVAQVKGRGVADADKLVNLSDKHRMVIQRLIDMDWDQYTSEQILKILENYYKSTGEVFKSNPYKRTISELFRRGILICPLGVRHPPKYSLNKKKALECLVCGKFDTSVDQKEY